MTSEVAYALLNDETARTKIALTGNLLTLLEPQEYNPDEYLNGDLNQWVRSGLVSRITSDLAKKDPLVYENAAKKTTPCEKPF